MRPATCWYDRRSEEHTSELQSRRDLVCRLLLEKKNLSEVQFHGTTPKAAAAIARERFSGDVEARHGRFSGQGVYLHPNERVSAFLGTDTATAEIDTLSLNDALPI